MPAEGLTMRKIREVFRLKFDCNISIRQIAISCNIARSMVGEYLFRFKQAALAVRWNIISVQLTPQYVGLQPLSKNDFISEC